MVILREAIPVKRARQSALLRRQVAETTIASHGGKRNMMTLLSPQAAGPLAIHNISLLQEGSRASSARPSVSEAQREARPRLGSLSARGREVRKVEPAKSAEPELTMQSIAPSRAPVRKKPGRSGPVRSNSAKFMSEPPSISRPAKSSPEVPEAEEVPESIDPEDRARGFMKRYGLGAVEVGRLLNLFDSALASCNQQKAGCLRVSDFAAWICVYSGLNPNRPVPGHLLEPWPQDSLLTVEDFFAWHHNHQWNEEIMVPDPKERQLRHFCKKQGYHVNDVEAVKAAFDRADKDGSGMLDHHEFQACYASLEGIEVSQVNEAKFRVLWQEVDEDQSGSIDLFEFAKWYLRVNPPKRGGATHRPRLSM